MSGRVNSRNGSALLIVLGMLSFMVISAVAFSMFMRENRLPSSFLRQKLVANHLVKAALANAMNEIDAAIGSDPYPYPQDMSASGNKRLGDLRNEWKNRVFVGRDGDLDETVPTLTLEALAYLPPPLINTVRYMSRHTPTANWRHLKYDAGRYAYTAVNVSDYLDINRLRANVMRDSSPSNRVSLAYLFENESHTGAANGVSPEKFDNFMAEIRKDSDYDSRLISLADYNLAIGTDAGKAKYQKDGEVFKSPFVEYFSGEGDGMFYRSVSGNMDDVKRQQFVTDSWYPAAVTNVAAGVYLSDGDDDSQPFGVGDNLSLVQLVKTTGSKAYQKMQSHLDVATLGALYDYIDRDSVPISLACPTLERTPMLTGLTVLPTKENFRVGLKYFDKDYPANPQQGTQASKRRTWLLDSIGDGKLLCSAFGVFPFKRTFLNWEGKDVAPNFTAQILVKAFFSDVDFEFEKTRLNESLSFKPTSKNDWNNDEYALGDSGKAYMKIVKQGTVSIVKSNEDRVAEEDCQVKIDFGDVKFDSSKIAGLGVYGLKFDVNAPESGSYDKTGIVGPEPLSADVLKGQLYYYDKNGNITSILSPNDVSPSVSLKLNFVVYVRILLGDDTVDLVPATIADDAIYNGRDSLPGSYAERLSGPGEPVLPMSGTSSMLDVNLGAFCTCAAENSSAPAAADATFNSLKIFCNDPRFNYAPEDWYSVPTGVNFSWDKWVADASERCDGQDGRQNDIFQFVSDRGYLQSMGELQFLPNLDEVGGGFYGKSGGPKFGTAYYSTTYNGAPFEDRDSADKTANRAFAWRTHWAFGEEADWADGPEYSPYGWGISDARDGVAVSPNSTSDELMMAGLANTPYDWSVSGLASDGLMDASDVEQFCFNGYGSEAPLKWEDLKKVAAHLRKAFASGQGWDNDLSGSATGTDQWNEWWSEPGKILGVAVDDVHDVDRKFLYSYWKGCFADRQQLFLIFVRAEPTSVGAGVGSSHSPAQLGARAVALVWREPVSSIASNLTVDPHRMRILFYHQFE